MYASGSSSFGSTSGSASSLADSTINLKVVEAFYKLMHGTDKLPKDFSYSASPTATSVAPVANGMDIDVVPASDATTLAAPSESKTLSATYASRLNKPNIDDYKTRANYHYSFSFDTNLAEAIYHAESKAGCPPNPRQQQQAFRGSRGGAGERGSARGARTRGGRGRGQAQIHGGDGNPTEQENEDGAEDEEQEESGLNVSRRGGRGGRDVASKILLPWSLKSRTAMTDKYIYSACWQPPKDELVVPITTSERSQQTTRSQRHQPSNDCSNSRIPGKSKFNKLNPKL
jgi:hypothetical protein